MLTLNRHLLAGTALAFAVGVSAPATLLAQQSTSPSTGNPPASSSSNPVMNQSQTGTPSTSGAAGSSTGAGSSTTGSSAGGTAGAMDSQVAAMGDKLEGKDLYGANNEKVGEIDKVVMGPDNKVNSVLVDIGGFLGIGAKTVSIPVAQLRAEGDRVVAQNLTKEQAKGMQEYKESDADRTRAGSNTRGTGTTGTSGGTSAPRQ